MSLTNIFRLNNENDTTTVNTRETLEVLSFVIAKASREFEHVPVTLAHDIMRDAELMQNIMDDGESYVWSIRECGTWLMHIRDYMKHIAANDNYVWRFLVSKNGDSLEFSYIDSRID